MFRYLPHTFLSIIGIAILWLQWPSANLEAGANQSILSPPGYLFDVGGYKLHLYCLGDNDPTVIFDSGAGGFSLEWRRIQETLSKDMRVCAYDRAGYGWSELGPMPRTTKRIATELHTLLDNAGITPPYIFVGHSFGGFTAQYFARNYKDEIAAMILIDSSHPDQNKRLPYVSNDPSRLSRRAVGVYSMTQPVMSDNYPEEFVRMAYHFMSSWKSLLTLREEMASFPISGRQIMVSDMMPDDIPLVILTRGQRVWPKDDYGDAMEKTWRELQDELALLSQNVTHVVAGNSGHHIHLDQPGVVIKAVRNLHDAVV